MTKCPAKDWAWRDKGRMQRVQVHGSNERPPYVPATARALRCNAPLVARACVIVEGIEFDPVTQDMFGGEEVGSEIDITCARGHQITTLEVPEEEEQA